MERKTKMYILILVIAAALLAAWRIGSSVLREDAAPVSDDALSAGIAERWGGGLPAGYEAEIADDLDETGHLFARLQYQEDVSSLLEKWRAPTKAQLADYQAMLTAHAAEAISEEHLALLARGASAGEGDFLAFSSEKDGAKLLLLYDRGERVLYLAESAG